MRRRSRRRFQNPILEREEEVEIFPVALRHGIRFTHFLSSFFGEEDDLVSISSNLSKNCLEGGFNLFGGKCYANPKVQACARAFIYIFVLEEHIEAACAGPSHLNWA